MRDETHHDLQLARQHRIATAAALLILAAGACCLGRREARRARCEQRPCPAGQQARWLPDGCACITRLP